MDRETPLGWGRLIAAIGHRWKFIIVCGLAGVLAGVIVASQTPSYFEVSASLQAIEETQAADVIGNVTAGELTQDDVSVSLYTVPSNHFIFVTAHAPTASQVRSTAYDAALLIAERYRSLFPDSGIQVNGTGDISFIELSSTEGAIRGAIVGVFVSFCIAAFLELWPREETAEPFNGYRLEAFARKVIRHWPVPLACLAAGVLVGWLAGYIPTPHYTSSSAVVLSSIDKEQFAMDEDPEVLQAFGELTEGGGSIWVDSDMLSQSFTIKTVAVGAKAAESLASNAATDLQRILTARYPDTRSLALAKNTSALAWPLPADVLLMGAGTGVFCGLLFAITRRPEPSHRNFRFRAKEDSFGTRPAKG